MNFLRKSSINSFVRRYFLQIKAAVCLYCFVAPADFLCLQVHFLAWTHYFKSILFLTCKTDLQAITPEINKNTQQFYPISEIKAISEKNAHLLRPFY